MSRGRLAFWIAQLLLLAAVVTLVWRGLSRHWEQLSAMDVSLAIRPAWLALAALLVLLTYGLLIEAWRRLLLGWGERLRYRDAVRIWTISNLGRYIPGKVWALAGQVVLAQRVGVAGWAAGGSAVVMQGLGLGTGVATVVACLPGELQPGWIAAAAVLAFGTIAVPSWPRAVAWLGRIAGRPDLRPLAWTAVATSALATLASWIAYGVAFWALVRGVLAVAIPVPLAIGVFAAGYIAGLLAAFAPGGIGVREGVIAPLLAGALGGAGALVAAVAQRILFTATEGLAAVVGLVLGGFGSTDGD